MAQVGQFLSDPWTIRTVLSIVAGMITALVTVRLTFYLRNQQDLFRATRAIRSELEHDAVLLSKLARLLKDDMRTQHVDLPVEVPPGTTIEIRYVLSLPAALTTSSFEQLKQSGMLTKLPPEVRRQLFDLYDVLDRINRLREHREALHYNHLENVHIVVDPSELDVDPRTTVREEDLPAETRARLDDLRRMRDAMRGINTSTLRLIAAISSAERLADLGLEEFDDRGSNPRAGAASEERTSDADAPTVDEMMATLEDIEERSFWSRFV